MADLQNLRCQASIEASILPIQIQLGRLSLPSESTIHSLLTRSFSKLTETFNLRDPDSLLSSPSTLSHILDAILDTTSRPFANPNSELILAGLDDHDKACLYMQAIAGMVLIFERLKTAEVELSASLLARKLRLFAESKQRQVVLDTIAGSHCFSESYTRSDVVEFLVNAVQKAQEAVDEFSFGRSGRNSPEVEEVSLVLGDSWGGSGERPCKNMGLPWGFTIMALN
ncbi:hypothetical protein QBC38DRAFT_447576 [Podospora fimiseda]|uniref:Uncharacterized protein n=1 Tax=Podospora fimiseda TaxID=252190 RepID=A0AAN7BGZ1_9PEZI|nr:hypothetical protein QBC38DRAFT_447576 [Podospora fimiseda]